MGITNPVTKETSGSVYMQELSRQLADFVFRLLESSSSSGGMMQLVEVYCAFNRARGTELITPDDLLKACKMFTTLKLPLRLAKFESGVLVVQLVDGGGGSGSGRSNGLQEKIVEHLTKMSRSEGGRMIQWGVTTATNVSVELNIALFVAQAELVAAETNQLVVRDVSYDGTQWYLAHSFFKK